MILVKCFYAEPKKISEGCEKYFVVESIFQVPDVFEELPLKRMKIVDLYVEVIK